jgi:hypothetical protein
MYFSEELYTDGFTAFWHSGLYRTADALPCLVLVVGFVVLTVVSLLDLPRNDFRV